MRLDRALGAFLLAACVLGALARNAVAHPHVWITVETTVLFDKGAFVGLQHKWTFDEFYTAMAIEGLDKNHDGIYDREELSELAKVNVDGLKEFEYFTYPTLDGKEVKLADARDYWLEHKNNILSLTFTLPFAQPVPAQAKNFTFLVQDPTFFIAFGLAKDDPIKLGGGSPKSCKVAISKPGEKSDDAQRLAKVFAQLGPMIGYATTVSVACPPL
jgi:ABC-type uncharacterized transport system substrate-binding protein